MNKRFENKHVIVTGGANGIGQEIARRFGLEGARLSIFDNNADALEKCISELIKNNTIVDGYCIDVSNQNDVQETVDRAENVQPIDVLVNNAGICLVTPFLNIEQEEWQRTLDVNLTGAFYVAQAVCRHMARRKRGVVIQTSSKNGLDGEFGHTHYNASKAGMILMTKTIAIELAHLGIRANAVCPGYTRSPINEEVDSDEFVEAFAERYIPYGRVGRLEDVAPLYLFLASDEASYITGQTFVIDGGQLAGQKPWPGLLDEITLI